MDFMTYFVVGGLAVSHGFAYYLGHRGFAGVNSDLHDVKNDIAAIKKSLPFPVPGPVTSVPVPGPVTSIPVPGPVTDIPFPTPSTATP